MSDLPTTFTVPERLTAMQEQALWLSALRHNIGRSTLHARELGNAIRWCFPGITAGTKAMLIAELADALVDDALAMGATDGHGTLDGMRQTWTDLHDWMQKHR